MFNSTAFAEGRAPGRPAPAEDGTFGNWLLRGLPAEDQQRVALRLEHLTLSVRTVLSEPDSPVRYIYFPDNAVLSVISHLRGRTVEVGTVGVEGMVGLAALFDAGAEPLQVICQIAGTTWRMEADVLRELIDARSPLVPILHRYAHAFLVQVAQTAACNGAHSLEQRCARWLLMTHDRVGAREFELTHQFLAFMLGVRRAGVTVAMRALQRVGIVRYTRGHITILDRSGLEAESCECYGTVRAHYERLLPHDA